MTTDDAILTLKDIKKFMIDKTWYDAISTAIKALEKQIPKKPVNDGHREQVCSCCCINKYGYISYSRVVFRSYNYCPTCGRAIDWSDEEEEVIE